MKNIIKKEKNRNTHLCILASLTSFIKSCVGSNSSKSSNKKPIEKNEDKQQEILHNQDSKNNYDENKNK